MTTKVTLKRLITLLSLLLPAILFSACDKKLTYQYGEKEMIVKVWEDNIIYNETVVLEDNGTTISGQLLFEPTEIISIRDYTLEKEYDITEYTFDKNFIIRSETSTMPYLTTEQLAGKNLPEEFSFSTYQAKEPGTEIIFTEGIGIVMHQIAVTYKHEGKWTGITPVHQPLALQKFKEKLEAGLEVTIVLNGDSISTGANSSGVLGIKPYMDDFGTMFKTYLENTYHSKVNFINTSLGGTMSSWGKENVDPNVNQYQPDLVIIGFGMNDGSLGVKANTYHDNIEFMIKSIKATNSDANIILMHTIYANPLSLQNQNQESYLTELENLKNQYDVALLDMGSITETMYKTKKGVDILANNINHPSDFLVRIYTASLIQILEG